MTKIISYNVNGIRAALNKDFGKWLKAADPDVVCLQEVKALEEQVDLEPFISLGYNIHWHAAEKKGYSGVAILSRLQADRIQVGMGMDKYDSEGRVLRMDIDDLSYISAYFPSGSSGDARQDFKMEFLSDFSSFIAELKKERKKLIISGDYNICHKPIDIHNPVSNKKSSGFLPEEREWMSTFINSGFIDTFRYFNDAPHNYTWWSYRAGARKRNLGWRIDYHMVTSNLEPALKRAEILSDAVHSDHCPILLEIV
ncbi:MAG: exodeoxyribonuclease III [Flavobacteriales bacterium]|nr:exodeoxyribonuclease III [Flavobacteriales bacterium]